MASLQPSNAHDGNPHISPGKSKADSQEACVEPTDVMRKEHYLFLLHQRDETVVNGIRTKNHSLANCIDCHVSYDEKGKAYPIPKTELPVKLPENINLNVKGNPLDSQNEWKEILLNGKKLTRETDTLDTFVDSS